VAHTISFGPSQTTIFRVVCGRVVKEWPNSGFSLLLLDHDWTVYVAVSPLGPSSLTPYPRAVSGISVGTGLPG
jgi:hypothetical protein